LDYSEQRGIFRTEICQVSENSIGSPLGEQMGFYER